MGALSLLFAAFAAVTIFIVKDVEGHGAMVKPITWFDKKQWINTPDGVKYEYVGQKPMMQCYTGCDLQSEDICPDHKDHCDNYPYPGCSCMWFNNYTTISKPTLFDQKLRTYAHSGKYDILHNPWRAPGFAKVDSPCGVAGGNLKGCIGGSCTGGGYQFGMKAEEFKFKHEIKITNWKRGSTSEVAWAVTANHGGGYSYRLCKVPSEGVKDITEDCFQKTPLEFYNSSSWIQYGEDESTRKEFKATRTNVGTFPEGSQWSKNPIPACNGADGGYFSPVAECKNGTQFPPPVPGVYGFGTNVAESVMPFQFSVVDLLKVPNELESGHYVLSFRWDCEQTSQVWNTCASIFLS